MILQLIKGVLLIGDVYWFTNLRVNEIRLGTAPTLPNRWKVFHDEPRDDIDDGRFVLSGEYVSPLVGFSRDFQLLSFDWITGFHWWSVT